MKELFPVEMQENFVQTLWIKRHNKTKIIYLIIVIVLLLVLIWLPFVYVDVSSQSRGVVRSVNENNMIQSLIYAEIEKVNLDENKLVQIGDTLIYLRTDEIDEQMKRLNERLIENKYFISDLNCLLLKSDTKITTLRYNTELSHYNAKVLEQDIQIQKAESEYIISKKLYEKGVETMFDFQQAESHYTAALSQKNIIIQQQNNNWQTEVSRLEIENKNLRSEYQQLEKRKNQYFITASMSGTVVQYNGVKPGNFIQTGQTIAQITTSDTLFVECYVSPFDIGYINIGQKVLVQIDSYNYQQWGLLEQELWK